MVGVCNGIIKHLQGRDRHDAALKAQVDGLLLEVDALKVNRQQLLDHVDALHVNQQQLQDQIAVLTKALKRNNLMQ